MACPYFRQIFFNTRVFRAKMARSDMTYTKLMEDTVMKYYPIDEEAARRAKQANSFSDYTPGSATAEYRAMNHEKIDRLLDRYARRLAGISMNAAP